MFLEMFSLRPVLFSDTSIFHMTCEKQKKAAECLKTSRECVHERDNERKGHKERRRGTEGVNKAGENAKERKKEQ